MHDPIVIPTDKGLFCPGAIFISISGGWDTQPQAGEAVILVVEGELFPMGLCSE